jgi:hypothetical protein
VSGHLPKLLGTWGLSTISLGKSVIQERQEKERKFRGGRAQQWGVSKGDAQDPRGVRRKRAWS